MPHFKLADGRTLAYTQYGDAGAPVVLLHGYLDSHVSFFRLTDALVAGHRLFVPDQRGHGDSDPAADYSIAGFTQDAVAFIAGLAAGPVHLAGHSLGGIVAQRVAAARPDLVRSLALISTGRDARGNTALQETAPLLETLTDPIPDALAREFQGSSCFTPLPESLFVRLLDETRKVKAATWRGALAGLLEEPAPDDAARAFPTLILWGEDDGIFGAPDQKRLREHFRQARFTAFPQTGHVPNWERPDDTAAALLSFWRDAEGGARSGNTG